MRLKTVFFIFLGIILLLNPVLAEEYGVSVSVSPKEMILSPYPVPPGSFDIDIKNTGELEDTFTITITGLPESWYSLSEDTLTLKSGESGKVYLFVSPYEGEFGTFEATVTVLDHSEATDTFTLEVVSDHNIEITLPDEITTCLQEETDVVATIKNTGEHPEDITLTVSEEASDLVELSESSFSLELGEEKDVTLTVNPEGIEVGNYSLELKASTKGYATATTLSVINIIECYEVEVLSPEEVTTCKDVSELFTIMIKNVGLKKDSYELKIEALDYTASVDLEAEGSESFEIPFSEEEVGSYDVDFVVESDFTKAEGMIKFIVVKCYGVDLSVEETEFEIEMGRGKLIKARATNTGTKADTFDIVSDIDWVSIKPSTVELTPNESKFVYVYYSPEFGLKGTFNTTLTAKSESSQDGEKLVIDVVEEVAPETVPETIEIPETVEEEEETVETTVEETTIEEEEEETVETTAPEIPEIPTGEAIGAMEKIWGNKLLRSLMIAIIVVLIILIVIYLVVMR